jgi:methionine-rich copper-binding protein CopC
MTWLLRLVGCTLVSAAVALTGMPVAAAHTVLVSSDPAADATLTAGPATVSATFNEDLQPSFAAMTVVGPDANLWSAGEPRVSGAVVSVGLRPLGPSGRYTVNYRVTSADGHVVSGSWSFTVTTATTAAPGPAVSTDASETRIPLWPFIVGIGLLVAGAAAWGLRRRS